MNFFTALFVVTQLFRKGFDFFYFFIFAQKQEDNCVGIYSLLPKGNLSLPKKIARYTFC
ncbi:hypothetical protein M23134_03991 [Microscilla marina ATCC 23134]|uniref:Uncharacterized protein n=1 Tax=Microscilla marina ATCC 23134 TaxID=313606 RepID=A1ZMP8_MICM2|nr:hypothetical protein M23134_03991 [Microscilla marina ATCC 23134]